MTTKNGSDGSVKSAEGNTKPRRANAAIRWTWTMFNTTEDRMALLALCLKDTKFWLYGREVCPTTSKAHLQGYLEFSDKKRPNECSSFKDLQIHWEGAKGTVDQNIKYCIKDGNWTTNDKQRIEKYIEKTNLLEKFAFNQLVTYEELYDWQKRFVDKFKHNCDKWNRQITWVYEPDGNIGKSVMAKYFVDNMYALCVNGKGADVKCGLTKFFEHIGFYPPIIIIDIPRVNENHISYQAIEEIKNGLVFSGKYESNQFRMNTPWIIVFANERPDTTKLSKDRWEIIEASGLMGISPADGPPLTTASSEGS